MDAIFPRVSYCDTNKLAVRGLWLQQCLSIDTAAVCTASHKWLGQLSEQNVKPWSHLRYDYESRTALRAKLLLRDSHEVNYEGKCKVDLYSA